MLSSCLGYKFFMLFQSPTISKLYFVFICIKNGCTFLIWTLLLFSLIVILVNYLIKFFRVLSWYLTRANAPRHLIPLCVFYLLILKNLIQLSIRSLLHGLAGSFLKMDTCTRQNFENFKKIGLSVYTHMPSVRHGTRDKLKIASNRGLGYIWIACVDRNMVITLPSRALMLSAFEKASP